jgi:hypothetical protein
LAAHKKRKKRKKKKKENEKEKRKTTQAVKATFHITTLIQEIEPLWYQVPHMKCPAVCQLCCKPQFPVHVARSTRCTFRMFHELSSTVCCVCAASRSFRCMLHVPHVAGSECFMNCPAQYFSVVLHAAVSGACCTFHTLQAQIVS